MATCACSNTCISITNILHWQRVRLAAGHTPVKYWGLLGWERRPVNHLRKVWPRTLTYSTRSWVFSEVEHFESSFGLRDCFILKVFMDTFGKCQRPVFSLGSFQHMHKITNPFGIVLWISHRVNISFCSYKPLDTFGKCHRPVFSLGAFQHMSTNYNKSVKILT